MRIALSKRTIIQLGIGVCLMSGIFRIHGVQSPAPSLAFGRTYRVSVQSQLSWTDTGLQVFAGQEISFQASGTISLQRGNPIARCDPEGYDLQTVQQPMRDRNIGVLIGRIVQLISVEVDEETGEEKRNERIEYFYIGSENSVRMPMNGKLYLGVNENVVEDNSGEFSVLFTREN